MIEKKKIKKLKEKKKSIIARLKELGEFPNDLNLLTNEQQKIYDQLEQFDFSFWEKIKLERGWGPQTKKSEEEVRLRNKREYIRGYFRQKGELPPYGAPLNEEQQKILDQIERNDFSYHEEYVKNVKLAEAKNNTQASERKKRERVRAQLRKYNELPPYGEPMNEDQQKIWDQIENNDFSYYDQFIKDSTQYGSGNKNASKVVVENSKPKMVLHRLRMVQILPKVDQPLNEEQEAIIQDVRDNWEGKTKNYFIKKYLYLSTAEGRLFYRLYKAHREFGYNFNLEVEDIVIPEYCPYLNIKLSTDPSDMDKDNYYTGDRIDSSKGYLKGNLQVISLLANRMKSKATQEQLLKFAVNGLNLIKKLEEDGKNGTEN